MPLAARWRVLDSGAADGATNMALDHALLLRAASHDEAVLRIYAWTRPTISFGMHERARLTPETVAAHGIDAVRRPTGGRALLHHREVTYSVTAPVVGLGLAESYGAINAILLRALGRLGVAATVAAPRTRTPTPDGIPCFAEPNAGEIVVDGRKLVGSAQRRDAQALLQHGSILLDDDQPTIAALRGPAASVPAAATLNAALGRAVTYAEVRDALVDALGERAGGDCLPLEATEIAAAARAQRTRYADPQWTWRR